MVIFLATPRLTVLRFILLTVRPLLSPPAALLAERLTIMTQIYAVVDIVPGENLILGTNAQEIPISIRETIVVENPIFVEDGVQGIILDRDDKRKLKGLKPVTRNEDGDIYTFDGRMPLLSAAYAHLNPRTGVVSYTNAR
jgi:hypothetical protein